MKIGLTGGIATGKSLVAQLLVKRGANLIDLDQIAREVVEPGQPALQQITEAFGQAVLHDDGSLNRKKLGAIVFSDNEQRKLLESITHPAIRTVMNERMNRYEQQTPHQPVVVEVPLLFESSLEQYFDEIMVVYAPREVQLPRLMERNSLTKEEAEQRLAAQMDIEEKKRRADIVIDNYSSAENTEEQIERWWREKRLG
ncbi:MAG: dephospho-CoA kinase [Candidatus Cohnella colombiensis]|uniref:Dephospho-CoA kinase n=1 Tax=Candidatus Cohnella colombiensis TaxID=3121368 RepID=A0AA95JAP7_9BACL|nr:MAG: dephospho-CoA kinase [Cohnella sp.]